MTWVEAVLVEAQRAQTHWLLGLVALAGVLSGFAATERPRLRALIFFTVMHVVAIATLATLSSMGSPLADQLRVPAWVFGAVAFVGAGSLLLFSVALPRVRVVVPNIVQDVLVALLSVVIAVAVASNAGVNLSGLIATSAVFTAVLGFSLQDTIGNIAGGLALQVDNSVEVGDWIRLGTSPTEVNGRVVDIRWRYTAIETRNGETVLVPNRLLTNSQVMVLGRRIGQPVQWRRTVFFNVDYRHQPGDVIAVAQASVRGAEIPRVALEPAPNCVLMDMTESYGRYAMRYWLTDIAVDDPTDSEVRTRIFFGLERAGISLALPAQAVFVTEDNADRKQAKTQKQVQRRRKLLDAVALFASLSEDELDELSRTLKYAPFAKGERITRQGDAAIGMYLIEEGTAVVRVADGQSTREVAKLGVNDFFGEMSLLTGEPRSATVTAETDVECFLLEKPAFQRVIEKRPELAQQLATLLAERKVGLTAAKEGLEAESAKRRHAERDFLERIRGFFGL